MKSLRDRLADGDADAFESLYERCSVRLFQFLVSKTGSSDVAADVLQETFLRAVRFRDRLREVNNLEAWLFTIARCEADRMMARQNMTTHQDLAGVPAIDQPVVLALPELDNREELETAFAGLSSAEHEILELHFYGGLTFREIAEVTETPQGTVATRYRSVIAKLRKRLSVTSASRAEPIKETNQ
jgi:RNA polymerase sigma-70 factor (ECF subfamily)